ncbi:inositol monophosphatase family protein [Aestuariispira insulae]|uniref:Fructose-1,6-bisphosphatase/inositol monophosphatase family enzyme n=1 Tax=Aestuariispira insulae TaxID=1461337 RepID=A0A3D9HWE9_9PROT|nr:inositol monophosphatase [Aestuariispira insulae]RED53246.1 fructose-1,6-bisphosphatase/inositol monophosphatase family enzyme [Aestuariispira insulae]
MSLSSPERVTELLAAAADEFVMPRYRSLADDEVRQKAPGDLVTVADIETEHFLSEQLPAILPGSVVVGEEAHSRDPEILGHLEDHDAVWLVDPVDGTVNFARGSEIFCVMVALIIKGQAVQSWIYLPLEKQAAFAERGNGAYWGTDKIKVPEAPEAGDWLGQVNLAYFPKGQRDHVKQAAGLLGRIERLGCAGQDFLKQSRGERQFSLYRRLWSWDHVPGVLLLQEAGGYVARLDGLEYRVQDRVEGLLSTPNIHIWQDIKGSLLGS